VTCWSERSKRELAAFCAYRENQVEVTGAPAFDPYFQDGATWSREKLCGEMGLDAACPIILYASLGQFRPFMDETGTFAALVEALDRGLVPGDPQIVLRLHPLSRLVYFEPFLERSDVIVSRFKGYTPGMMWTPSRDEVIAAGNLMRHADVCISPGSTMTIEPAIFETPTLLPVVNLYTQEAYTDFFRRIWLEGHFKEIVDKDWVPVVRTVEELGTAIAKALDDPSWYREGRAAIRETILGPLDGRATERIADFVLRSGKERA
jgi:CDP-glycerol glycerophosphotransferase (TagB/SpsB family)